MAHCGASGSGGIWAAVTPTPRRRGIWAVMASGRPPSRGRCIWAVMAHCGASRRGGVWAVMASGSPPSRGRCIWAIMASARGGRSGCRCCRFIGICLGPSATILASCVVVLGLQ
eukprot:1137346-Pelagomonas_calceolata.AAC.3